MNSNLKRGIVAVATTFACLVMLSNPVSANASHSADITGGTVTLKKAGQSDMVISLASGGGSSCPAGTLTIAHDENVSPHTLNVTALTKTGEFTTGGNTYTSVITRVASTAGTHGSGTVSNVKVDVTAQIYGPITAGTCATTPLRCTLNTSGAGLDFSGTFDNAGGGAAAEPEINDVATISAGAVGIASAPPVCLTPFSLYNGGTAEVASMTALLTS